MILVTVIMSTYNEEVEWIKKSVESILNQSYRNIEFIVVVDNPHNREIINLLSQYASDDKRLKVVENEENIGLVKSLNKAIVLSRGDYIARMDADDISELDRIRKQLEYITTNDFDLIFSGVHVIDELDNPLHVTNEIEISPENTAKILKVGNISKHPTWFVKRNIYQELHGYREMTYCEDYDLLLRVLNKEYKIAKMPGSVLKYRMRSTSICNSQALEQFLKSRELLKVFKRKRIEDIEYIEMKIEKSKQLKLHEKNSFITFMYEFNNTMTLFKSDRKMEAFKKLAKSFFTSKYSFLKVYDFTKYRIAYLLYK